MSIKNYQIECFNNYKQHIEYPTNYTYFYGTRINPLVPIETCIKNVMIVGAYPSARFFTINKITDVPVANNDSPFSDESYFDGTKVRTVLSGKELNDEILSRIGVKRNECWITNLVKVFLFKKGHVEKYVKLGKTDISENRSLFLEYAQKSIYWLEKEISICNPSVIVLLGAEVVRALFQVSENTAKKYLYGDLKQAEFAGKMYKFICLPHPGILMRESNKNKWPELFKSKIAPNAKVLISDIRKNHVEESILFF